MRCTLQILSFIFILVFELYAQETRPDSIWTIRINEAANELLSSRDSLKRVQASNYLTHQLDSFLSTENAFNQLLDQLIGLSVLKSEDNKVRLITWQLYHDPNHYTYHGFIQHKNGSYKKLKDGSPEMKTVEFSVHKPNDWYGALYYNIHHFKHKGKDHYLLFGYDAFELYNKRKVLDVLHFDDDFNVKFGAPLLEIQDAYKRKHTVHRYLLEYSSSVNVTLNYSKEMNMVIYDHLIYGTPIKEAGPSNVPDGSYCGLKLTPKGLWEYVDKVYKDDPNNILIDATTFDKMIQATPSNKEKRDIFGRPKSN